MKNIRTKAIRTSLNRKKAIRTSLNRKKPLEQASIEKSH
jgi:hypothetical protein